MIQVKFMMIQERLNSFLLRGSHAEDIASVRNQGLQVDDDNQPSPENIPINENEIPLTTNLYLGRKWGWEVINQHEVAIQTNIDAAFENGWSPSGKSWMDIFPFVSYSLAV